MEIQAHVSLASLTWWKIGGPAEYFCLPNTIEDVGTALEFAQSRSLPVTVLGGGTNVLISDAGIRGLVLCTRQLKTVVTEERGDRLVIEAFAGAPKAELVKQFLRRKLPPALFLCGLPGEVGGGVVMNAGVGEAIVPREFTEITDWLDVVPFGSPREVIRLARSDLQWSYRHLAGWPDGVVVRAGLSWRLTDVDAELPRKVKDATKQRLLKQPLELPSCGSTFKNPPGQRAGALIDGAGLKGYRVGGAEVSLKHANFIVNQGGATSADVRQIILVVQSEVERRFGVRLETEVRFLGE